MTETSTQKIDIADTSHGNDGHAPLTNWTVFSLAFTSGFIIMSIELLGGRVLAPYFGNSIYVWGSIITVFMVSLSIGYLSGGHLSLISPRLNRYGFFFLAAAIATIPTILFGDSMMDWVFLKVEDPRYGSLIAAALLFFHTNSDTWHDSPLLCTIACDGNTLRR